jgi:hypothetical protein
VYLQFFPVNFPREISRGTPQCIRGKMTIIVDESMGEEMKTGKL